MLSFNFMKRLDSPTERSLPEEKAHARQTSFGLRKLRDVDRAHVEAAVGQHSRRSREFFSDKQTVPNAQDGRGERLGLVNQQDLAAERINVNHVGISEYCMVVEGRTTRLQVQTVKQPDRAHMVAVRRDKFSQSSKALP